MPAAVLCQHAAVLSAHVVDVAVPPVCPFVIICCLSMNGGLLYSDWWSEKIGEQTWERNLDWRGGKRGAPQRKKSPHKHFISVDITITRLIVDLCCWGATTWLCYSYTHLGCPSLPLKNACFSFGEPQRCFFCSANFEEPRKHCCCSELLKKKKKMVANLWPISSKDRWSRTTCKTALCGTPYVW